MNRIRLILTAAAALLAMQAVAQPSQLEPNCTFMFKLELGYTPFMCNTGTPGAGGYVLAHQENMASVGAVAGANLYQDWFVGGGVEGGLFHSVTHPEAERRLGGTVFVDADYRPVRHSVGDRDYKPVALAFAPLAGVRAGASLLMADAVGISPMAEVYVGISWYYARGLHNSTLNRHSVYAPSGWPTCRRRCSCPSGWAGAGRQ